MEEALLKKIDEISDEMISGIKRVVQIDSVQSEAKPGMPFGEGVNKALEEALKLARELGFETENVDHMVGIAKYGQGEDYIGIMGHLDGVPVGEGWNHPPFSAYEDENGNFPFVKVEQSTPVRCIDFERYVDEQYILYKQGKFFQQNQVEKQWEKRRNLSELFGKQVCIAGCGSVGTECAKRFFSNINVLFADSKDADFMEFTA